MSRMSESSLTNQSSDNSPPPLPPQPLVTVQVIPSPDRGRAQRVVMLSRALIEAGQRASESDSEPSR